MGRIHLQPHAWTHCPACGELRQQRVHSVSAYGRPDAVECPACGHRWTWPSEAEFARRRAERERARSKGRKRAREPKPKPEPLAMRTCPWCGLEFQPRNRSHVYCSQRCSDAARRRGRGQLVALMKQAELLDAALDGRWP